MSARYLRGMTWNHSRALPPLVAASQRFEELHPETRIQWEKRSLDEFGHAGLATLSHSYDLIVIDHPMLGEVHRNKTLVDLQPLLQLQELAEFESDSLGPCLASYRYDNCLYALPLDAAAPAASYRPDLLERNGCEVPTSWEQVIELAQRGLVRMPGFPADLFLNLMGMCVSRGSSVTVQDQLFESAIAIRCLEEIRELASWMTDEIYRMNPIAIYEAMTSTDEFAYCPFAYTYSNYSRPGFAANTLLFASPVELEGGIPLRTVLGGTGIAVSSQCADPATAVDFCLFVAGRDCQSHLYGICGGQPASGTAWRDPLLNRISSQFFERTIGSIKNAYVRPRFPGYISLQQSAGLPIIEYLRHGATAAHTLQRLDKLYQQSLIEFQNHAEATK